MFGAGKGLAISKIRWVLMNKNHAGYLAMLAILVAASALSLKLFSMEGRQSDICDIRDFPMIVGGWVGKDAGITEREYGILETRNLVSREYSKPGSDPLYLFIIYSETNRRVFHPPEVCMLGSDIAIVDRLIEKVPSGGKDYAFNKLYTEKGAYKGLVLYGYKAGNTYTDNYYLQQAYLAFMQLFGRRAPGATVRVSVSMERGEAATLEVLKDFLSRTIESVDRLSSPR